MLTEATVKILDRSERRERARLAWRAGRFECCECGHFTETRWQFVARVWKLWRQREVTVYPDDPLVGAVISALRPAAVLGPLVRKPGGVTTVYRWDSVADDVEPS